MRGGIADWRRATAILAGLDQAEPRFRRRCATARAVTAFLAAHPLVEAVFHPTAPGHPDAAVIATHYTEPGSIVSLRLRDADEAQTRHFCDVLAMCGVLRYALSFDGLATKLNHHRSVSEYFTAEEEVRRIGVDRLVRMGIGVEHPDDLIACLNWALWHRHEITSAEIAAWQAERAGALGLGDS
jgi:cystathionine beta-lyase/cystathionine gamma-synthase